MPLTYVGAFGSLLVTQKRAVQVTTDNALVIEVRLEITIGSEIIKVSQLPDLGTSNTFTFEINTILRNYLKSKLLPLTQGSVSGGMVLSYSFQFFGTDASGVNISGENVAPPVSVSVSYNFSTDELKPFVQNDYSVSSGSAVTNLLTDYHGVRRIIRDSYGMLSALNPTTGQRWIFLSNAGGENSFLPIGTPVGSLEFGSSFVFQATGTATEYYVFIADLGGGAGFAKTLRSKIYTFKVIDTPCNYLELFWVNQFGAMESWVFDTNYSDSTSIEKLNFQKNRPVNPSALDRGQDVYKVESVRRFRVWSDYESMENIKFLNSIALSPQVAIMVNGVLVPVIVENDSVDNFNYHEPINRITFDIVLSNKRINIV